MLLSPLKENQTLFAAILANTSAEEGVETTLYLIPQLQLYCSASSDLSYSGDVYFATHGTLSLQFIIDQGSSKIKQ